LRKSIEVYLSDVEQFFVTRFVQESEVRNQSSLGQVLDILMFTADRLKRRFNSEVSLGILRYFMDLNILCLQVIHKRNLIFTEKK
jgi:hypothetical protein